MGRYLLHGRVRPTWSLSGVSGGLNASWPRLGAVLGLLYDVHGNLPALEAVLEDARGAGAERFLLGGDYALFGAWPTETVELLRELDAEWIRGNGERWTDTPDAAPEEVQGATERCRELLGEELVRQLATLPETFTGEGVLYCHASPRSDVENFLPQAAEDEAELLLGVAAERLVFGHTHLSFQRTRGVGI